MKSQRREPHRREEGAWTARWVIYGWVVIALVGSGMASAPVGAQARRAIRFEDQMAIKRVGDGQISPDGKRVAYVVTNVDVEANRG